MSTWYAISAKPGSQKGLRPSLERKFFAGWAQGTIRGVAAMVPAYTTKKAMRFPDYLSARAGLASLQKFLRDNDPYREHSDPEGYEILQMNDPKEA